MFQPTEGGPLVLTRSLTPASVEGNEALCCTVPSLYCGQGFNRITSLWERVQKARRKGHIHTHKHARTHTHTPTHHQGFGRQKYGVCKWLAYKVGISWIDINFFSLDTSLLQCFQYCIVTMDWKHIQEARLCVCVCVLEGVGQWNAITVRHQTVMFYWK